MFRKAEHLTETQAGTFSNLLRREEGFENDLLLVSGNSDARVGDTDGHEATGARRLAAQSRDVIGLADAKRQFAGAVHGVATIDGEIDDCGFELGDVGDSEIIVTVDLDIRRHAIAHQRPYELHDAENSLPDLKYLRLQWLTTRKGQQLACQFRCALDRLRYGVDVSIPSVVRDVRPSQQLGRRPNDRQNIVEVVSHAAGELSDRFHFLRMAQRLLGTASIGHVDGFDDDSRNRSARVGDRTQRHIEIPLACRELQIEFAAGGVSGHGGGECLLNDIGGAGCRGHPP